MSFTTTIEQRAEHLHPGTILLTPSRRRRSPTAAPPTTRELPTAELWKWTLRHEAITPCFIRDVFKMKEHGDAGKEGDFFWLGRVPCRTVQIVGLVVGVKAYEKRIVYTVDDGTSVIDCTHRQSPAKRPQANAVPVPLDTPRPIAYVGHSVCIVGKVKPHYGTRQILIDSLERCTSSNEEPNHWRKVLGLHKASYSLPGPFTIPPTPQKPASPVKPDLNQSLDTKAPPTPSTACSTPGPASPAKSVDSQKSPQKLRHPSRLHSRDLTDTTFQIYMKHFMIHAPPTNISRETEYQSDPDSAFHLPSTPTKRSRRSLDEETPRASFSRPAESTPRPSIPKLLLGTSHETLLSPSTTSSMQGFTLSYLRRVPELAVMARRVVKAEAKRRLREERNKAKEVTDGTAQNRLSTTSRIIDKAKISVKMKRLYKWAIVRLLRDGSIVLWEGPTHPCRQMSGSYTNDLWKANVISNSSIGADSTIFSSVTVSTNVDEDDEDMELSDPELGEEAYVPLSPSYLAEHVARAIGALTNVEMKNANAIGRPARSTKEGILAYLKKDDRWRFVGEWNVEEALQVLKSERRAWCVERGRWELTI